MSTQLVNIPGPGWAREQRILKILGQQPQIKSAIIRISLDVETTFPKIM